MHGQESKVFLSWITVLFTNQGHYVNLWRVQVGNLDFVKTLLICNVLGCKLHFLPPYSPDLNPIEESFSSCK
jgi:hypothetical protein